MSRCAVCSEGQEMRSSLNRSVRHCIETGRPLAGLVTDCRAPHRVIYTTSLPREPQLAPVDEWEHGEHGEHEVEDDLRVLTGGQSADPTELPRGSNVSLQSERSGQTGHSCHSGNSGRASMMRSLCTLPGRIIRSYLKSRTHDEQGPKWEHFVEDITWLNLYVISCRFILAPDGSAPCAHLGDGTMDLVVIKKG